MSKVAVSFTHIIKSGEPAFSVLVSRFLLSEKFPVAVYLSLLPIIGGCALAAVTELNFNITGKKRWNLCVHKHGFPSLLNMVTSCFRIHGSNDIESSIRVPEHLFKEGNEREISQWNELLCLFITTVFAHPHTIRFRCWGSTVMGCWLANCYSSNWSQFRLVNINIDIYICIYRKQSCSVVHVLCVL